MADMTKYNYVDPYGPAKTGLESFYPGLWEMYSGGAPDPLPINQQVAGLDPYQTGAIEQMGAYGAPGGAGAGYQQFLTDQLGAGLNMEEVAGYVDNDLLDSQIQAALRDPSRMFAEQTMPGLDLGQAFSGNAGGARGDLAEGVAMRGYADRASDVSANMRGNAYQNALQTALNTRGMDANMAGQANQMGMSNIDMQMGAGQFNQQQNQNELNAGMGNWQYGVEAPWWQAQNFNNLTMPGAANFGTQYGTDMTPDVMNLLLGGLAGGGLGGLFGGLFGDGSSGGGGGLWGDILDKIGLGG